MLSLNDIPNDEKLFRYVDPKALPSDQKEIPPGLFQDPSLSCDWEKYQPHPEKSFHINHGLTLIIQIRVCDEIKFPKNPKRIGEYVDAWFQKIYHSPVRIEDDPANGGNFSHSLIEGKKKAVVQEAIANNSVIYKRL